MATGMWGVNNDIWAWMTYSISWQILENKARSPVPEEDWVKGTFTFYSISTKIHKNSSPYHIVKDGVSCTPGAGTPPSQRGGASIPALHHRVIQVYSEYYIIYSLSPGCLMLIFSNWLPYLSQSWRLCQSPQTLIRWIDCAWEPLWKIWHYPSLCVYGCYWPSLGEANEYTTTASIIRSRLSLPKKEILKVANGTADPRV